MLLGSRLLKIESIIYQRLLSTVLFDAFSFDQTDNMDNLLRLVLVIDQLSTAWFILCNDYIEDS